MFVWRYLDVEGREVGTSEEFPDQESAEEWLRDSWEGLADEGVEVVALWDNAGLVYEMKLSS
jgi:hypothetical protein